MSSGACPDNSCSTMPQRLKHQHVFPASVIVADSDSARVRLIVLGGCNQTGQPVDACESLRLDGEVVEEFVELPRLPTPRAGIQTAVIGTKVYCFGGSGPNQSGVESIDSLDLGESGASWRSVGQLPCRIKSCAVAVRGNRIIVAGGMESVDSTRGDLLCYDCVSGKLAKLPSMLIQRYSPGSFFVDDTLYLFGGRQGRTPVTSAEAFDFRACKWRQLPDVPGQPRVFPVYCLAGRRVCCCGGLDPANVATGFSKECHAFQLDSDEWTPMSDLLIGRADAAYAVSDNGETVMLAAGFDNTGKPSRSCHSYNFGTGEWSERSQLPGGHMSGAFVNWENKLYVVGGIGESGVSDTVDVMGY